MRKIMEEVFSFWLKMAPLAQGVGQKWVFCHNFGSIQIFFNLFFALVLRYQHANLMEEKFRIVINMWKSWVAPPSQIFYHESIEIMFGGRKS
jgi:hypothetical protein